ncbi:solute carrier family 35 (UDP-sugar transporter), member A1/2/3 [Cryptococcus neoformans]|nr:solute carrier family 35 (UDP-sugar transporter), member A1/2/3 [Cryptococcus neoformans var. grubii AD1-83a]OXG63064.1 solute carrier family 35 (UDP-sugar transporter), member A1/2/3 [Cryptococcus neoformans var. grubii MW-RSA1955]OXG66272.1 solute carrier family 35 (UDP-sugar transporter), member A1/2/3 [Cryptococcus neoformans var. grubii c8]OXG68066.1 solute carrier family 35 (UDP-sugar transporter), member A1/2/3 [Cryptococcus neoformans var. grubii CHC193]OXH13639.1 solute carrier fami
MAHRTNTRSPSGLNRRPTDRRASQSGSMQTASSPVQSTFGGRVYTAPEEDRGLIMRDRSERDRGEKDWADEKANSMGKSRGMDVGVTRPKRRLSSLPNLLVPPLLHRAMSSTSVSSPPQSPIGQPGHTSYQSLQQQTFHNQKAHGSSTANNFSAYSRSTPPKLDDRVGMVGYATAMAAASREKEGPPSLWGIELKWISLITLALQNAFLTIIMHYSRISTAPNRTYSAAAAVLLNELLKGGISVFIALKRIDNDMTASPPPPVYSEKLDDKDFDKRSGQKLPSIIHPTRLQALSKAVFSPDCYKLSVPAILYVIQNNLQYVAASNLDVATFQVTYQMKILTTAFFSVLMLRKRLSRTKWASLVLLAIGVGIVQIQSSSAPAVSHHTHVSVSHEHQLRSEIPVPDEPIISPERVMHPIRGFVAVTLACMTSGLAGVYFEFILKSSSGSSAPDLWVRNTQLSLFSLVPALVPIIINPSGPNGMGYFSRVMSCFDNFNGWAVGTVLTQTFGGLITALVIRYSDNIMKGFATSLSIIISFLASVALFSYPITLSFIVGASIVLFATYTYNSPAPPIPSTRKEIAVPGSPISTSAPILGEPEKPSRASSVINLLGLGSNQGSRKPSVSDIKSYASNQLGLPSYPVSASASAPGTPGINTNDYTGSGRSSPASFGGAQASHAGSGAGFGRGNAGDKVRPILSLDIDRKHG